MDFSTPSKADNGEGEGWIFRRRAVHPRDNGEDTTVHEQAPTTTTTTTPMRGARPISA